MLKRKSLSGFFGGVAALALAAFGAGCGSSVCGGYCDIGVQCTADQGCELAQPDAYKASCTDACSSGFEALSGGERGAVEDCLRCITSSVKSAETCDPSTFLSNCQQVCGTVQASLEKWGEAAAKAQDQAGETFTCTNGRPITGDTTCSASGGGDGTTETCSMTCDTLLQVDCSGPAGGQVTCQCTVGKNQGKSFSSTCDALFSDPNKPWDECNL